MDSPSTPLSEANLTFTLALLNKLDKDGVKKNIFFSPFSIFSALTQVLLGAKGSTYEQISKVLGLSKDPEPEPQPEPEPEPEPQPEQPEQEQKFGMRTPMQSVYKSQMQTRTQLRMQQQQQRNKRIPGYLLKCLKSQTDGEDNIHTKVAQLMCELNKENAPYALSVANRMYGEKTYEFLGGFLADIKKYYGGELQSEDFLTKAEEARVNINKWVKEKTEAKIKDMLAEGALDESTRLVLVNAIYFKGLWEHKFEKENTEEFDFRISKDKTRKVEMMRQKTKFHLASISEANIQILEMTYQKSEISMLILLPNDIEDGTTGLEKLEAELTAEKFMSWTGPDKMKESLVDVKLPRFQMEDMYDLKNILKEMGMSDAFDVSRSDLTGMSPVNDLVLSKVLHKANFEVTEEGAEAVSGTSAVVSNRSAKIPDNFFADHPFLFFIRHNPSKTILFSGRYCSPAINSAERPADVV